MNVSNVKISDFKNILPNEETTIRFFDSYKKISKVTGCFYMGYVLEDAGRLLRVGFTTNLQWALEYFDSYVNHCHLWHEAQTFFTCNNNNSLVLPWATVSPNTKTAKDILLRREELDISYDGISFCKKSGTLREYYYFAPQLKQKNFITYLMQNLSCIRNEIGIFRHGSLLTINNHTNIPK